jgi:hypothetical protein
MASIGDKLANSPLGMATKRLTSWFSFKLLDYYKATEKDILKVLHEIYAEERGTTLFDPAELFMIYSLARTQKAHGGDFAEVGVYKGASAKAICAVKGDTPLHLFDTWNGIPSTGALDPRFKVGMFSASEEDVKKRLAPFPNVFTYKGLFPNTSGPVMSKRFSFVHLDVDTYESTKACLKFFYPRVLSGGIILSHDYAQAIGVRQAFDEFMTGKSDKFIDLAMTQCMIIKN